MKIRSANAMYHCDKFKRRQKLVIGNRHNGTVIEILQDFQHIQSPSLKIKMICKMYFNDQILGEVERKNKKIDSKRNLLVAKTHF